MTDELKEYGDEDLEDLYTSALVARDGLIDLADKLDIFLAMLNEDHEPKED